MSEGSNQESESIPPGGNKEETVTSASKRRRLYIVIAMLVASGAILYIVALTIQLSYLLLHLFLLIPTLGLALIPPIVLKSEPREIKLIGFGIIVAVAGLAVIFSTFWDNIIAAKGVWECLQCDLPRLGHIPIEEYLWFINHTLLAGFFVLSLWSSKKKVAPPPPTPRKTLRIIGTVFCFSIMILGLWLFQYDKSFYLGVILCFIGPVLGFLWWLGGHLLWQQRREWLWGITIISIYVLFLDTIAIYDGIWVIHDAYTTGIALFGIKLEQILIYTLTTALVVTTLVVCLRTT
ncbi:MAG: lycopene cyclase domain-containing protein, partial [Candidatus Helarchaeota archaeon]|nr:lycopene cyclase domain-containing protein [Candidatus Helarchaeota archaeon]